MGEVSEMFQVNPSLLRFWETEFDIIRPRKNKKGNRLFTQEDVANIRLIYHLVKERGYTLQGARQKLKENKNETENAVEIIEKLKKIRLFLLDLKENL